jgi:hypothetical protein
MKTRYFIDIPVSDFVMGWIWKELPSLLPVGSFFIDHESCDWLVGKIESEIRDDTLVVMMHLELPDDYTLSEEDTKDFMKQGWTEWLTGL